MKAMILLLFVIAGAAGLMAVERNGGTIPLRDYGDDIRALRQDVDLAMENTARLLERVAKIETSVKEWQAVQPHISPTPHQSKTAEHADAPLAAPSPVVPAAASECPSGVCPNPPQAGAKYYSIPQRSTIFRRW